MQRYRDIWYEAVPKKTEYTALGKSIVIVVFAVLAAGLFVLSAILHVSPVSSEEGEGALSQAGARVPLSNDMSFDFINREPYKETKENTPPISSETSVHKTDGSDSLPWQGTHRPADTTIDLPVSSDITAKTTDTTDKPADTTAKPTDTTTTLEDTTVGPTDTTCPEDTPHQPADPPMEERYEYGVPVPESAEVPNSYFADALFIGDSRTIGFSMHSGIQSTYWGSTGLNVSTAMSLAFVPSSDEKKTTILEALDQNNDYAKVYVAFGINEIGWYSSKVFVQRYTTLLQEIQKRCPDAVIYVQAIIPISQKASQTTYAPAGGNQKIRIYNEMIAQICAELGLHYVDVYTHLALENGALPDDAGFDGVHLNAKYYRAWASYLKTHTRP